MTSVSSGARLLVLAAAQPLELADAAERVLVDGVDVVRVALHEAVDAAELRERADSSSPTLCISCSVSQTLVVPRRIVEERADERGIVALVLADQTAGARGSVGCVPCVILTPCRCASAEDA